MKKTAILTAAAFSMLAASTTHGQSVIYEGFEFDVGALGTQGGATGTTGGYQNDDRYQVDSPSLSFGSIQTSGNRIDVGKDADGGGMSQNAIGLSSDLSDAGLLDNDDTVDLWFSFMYSAIDVANDEFGLALASEEWDPGLPTLVSGVGAAVDSGGTMTANFWDSDAIVGTQSGAGLTVNDGTTRLIVGTIEWGINGSSVDTLSLYAPGTDLVLGTAFSTVTYDATQSAYDTLTYTARNNNNAGQQSFDEIRFGATLASVTPVPEPSAFALLAGMFGLTWVMLRRRS